MTGVSSRVGNPGVMSDRLVCRVVVAIVLLAWQAASGPVVLCWLALDSFAKQLKCFVGLRPTFAFPEVGACC